MSNFIPTENRLGIQPISQTNLALPSQYQTGQSPLFGQAHTLGTIIRADDATLGSGEFIYLEGAANTRVGSLVSYNNVAGTTTLVPSTISQDGPVAVAMSANVAGQFGWYQIAGVATLYKAPINFKPGVKLYVSGTGIVSSASVAGKQVFTALSANAATVASGTSTITATINRPFMEPVNL